VQLDLLSAKINRIRFGSETRIEEGELIINVDQLREQVSADPALDGIEIAIANPGEDCRIIDIFDIFEPRCKLDGGANFPGLLDACSAVGNGATAIVRGAAVMVLDTVDDRFNTVVDMRGPVAELSPFARRANLCIRARPAGNIERPGYYRALKELGARAAVYLGAAAAKAPAPFRETFTLGQPDESAKTLPRVAYIYMIASQQVPTEPNEPILYGDNVRNLLPTVLHPNEILDGAIVAPYWNFGAETYSIQNHPMVLELYSRHLSDLQFAGVIATVAAETDSARTRTAIMAANIARHTLRADAVILTKYGGGIPESALMETLDACEALGMKCALAIWAHGGDGRAEGTLTFMSPRANAVVSCGIHDQSVAAGPMSRVIGRDRIGPLIIEPEDCVRPSGGPLTLKTQHIAGAINQLGGGRLSSEEY
jgi:sarcosine reductase